jgi:integrase
MVFYDPKSIGGTTMKRRMKGEGGVYLRNKTWWIFYQKDGRKVLETSGSVHKHDALALLKDRMAHPADKSYTVKDILDLLIQDYEDRGKKTVYKSASHLKPVYAVLGHLRVVDVNEDVIERYQRQRAKTHSNDTINRECQMLGQALNKLAYRRKIISRPVYIRKLEEFTARRDFFEPFEAEKVISFLPDYLEDFVRFAHISGWRKNEIATLEWSDVSFSSNIIRLNSLNSKTGDTRILPLTPELIALLERREKETVEGCPYIFHRRGYFIRDFRKSWSYATTQAGCAGRVFHALRRSSARDRIRAGVHERIVMSVNGWKTRSVFDRYNISSENDILTALKKTEEYRKLQISYNGNGQVHQI